MMSPQGPLALRSVPLTSPLGRSLESIHIHRFIDKVAMMFGRSKDGRNHTPEEFSSLVDIVAGFRSLAAWLIWMAY